MVFVLQASAFNVNYSDSGLFGFYTISQAAHAGEVSGHLECGCWQPVSEQHCAVPELQKQLVGLLVSAGGGSLRSGSASRRCGLWDAVLCWLCCSVSVGLRRSV